MLSLLLTSIVVADPTVISIQRPIQIDGVLDEAAWRDAVPITEFTKFQPVAGGPPPGTTDVRLLQDDTYLYVGVRIANTDYPIRARLTRREDFNDDDQIGVYLDTFNDGRSGYIFYFNGLGLQQDIRVGPGHASVSWDTVLQTRGKAHENGFDLEIAIPWRSLKYPKTDGKQTWGLILTRKVPSLGFKYSAPVTMTGHPQLFTQAMDLHGVRPSARGSGLELNPSLTLVQQAKRDGDQLRWIDLDPKADDAAKNWFNVVRPSLDVRAGLTRNVGLTAAVNPDFSQVDQDPTQINLNRRFAFFLPENRPFFLDGSQYFSSKGQALYSRSIVDMVYGAKVSGQEGPIAIGVLHAVDRTPAPTVHERDTPGFSPDDVEEAWALNDMVRARANAFGSGYVGVTVADKRLFRDGDQTASHTASEFDAQVPLGGRWQLNGHTMQTWTGKTGEGLMWGQQNSVVLNRASGVGTGLYLNLSDTTLGLRKETGFQNQSGNTIGEINVDHTFTPKGKIDVYKPGAFFYGLAERNGEFQGSTGLHQDITHHGVHTWSTSVHAGLVRQGVEEDPSGHIVDPTTVRTWWIEQGYSGTPSKAVKLNATVEGGRIFFFDTLQPAHMVQTSGTLTLRPTAGLRLDTTVRHDTLTKRDSSQDNATLVRHWTNWQFTRTLGLRSMVEVSAGNTIDDRLATSVMLTWLKHPGTAIHLGFIEQANVQSAYQTQNRTVFAKFSVLARP
jgi:hypothetical protein